MTPLPIYLAFSLNLNIFIMISMVKSFAVIVLLSLISKGYCACLDKINILTARSGREIKGQPEWNVTVTNNCPCTQKLIKLTCQGFQTVEPVSPAILSKDGDTCLLINGKELPAGSSVYFSYAWDPPIVFWPKDSVSVGC